MSEPIDLLDQKSHFAFGKNWASYACLVTEANIQEAVAGLRKLVGGDLKDKRFLDIGCGSGLHALAALRLGAREVVAVDIDPDSVTTTRQMLQAHAGGMSWQVLERSVFDLDPSSFGQFDVVYSWGVLHHTGDMCGALRKAAALVAHNGKFAFALYARTGMCWFWKIEKRWYARAGARAQRFARSIYIGLLRLRTWIVEKRRFSSFLADYSHRLRGMDFYHDVHDWMGGWPYESISPADVDAFMRQLGLRSIRASDYPKTSFGLFGSGCHEYVYGRF